MERRAGSYDTAANRVFDDLLDRIGTEWKVGDRLPSESELAAGYGCNRLTVRVALQKLNALGVVRTRPGSGTRVIRFDYERSLALTSRFCSMEQLTEHVPELRNLLELECARLACERATPQELTELERRALAHRRVWNDDAPDHEEWCRNVAAADMDFHRQVVRMSHNPLCVYAFAAVDGPVQAFILESVKKWPPRVAHSYILGRERDIHYGIYEAIARHSFADCESAFAAMLAAYAGAGRTVPPVG